MLTVCRLCLAKDAHFVICNNITAVRIVSCTGLEIDANDNLPQVICNACRLRLEEFHHFRRRCHAADRRLRSLKLLDHNLDPNTDNLIEDDNQDAVPLRDVAQCSTTVCSENNAHWRKEAAQAIRTEIDTYKRNLLSICRQQVREEIEPQVREEIEQQVRREVGDILREEARKECRVKLLDDLFYEIETLFVHKRNNTVREMTYGSEEFISDMEAAELGSLSTLADRSSNICEEELRGPAEITIFNGSEMSVVEVLDELPQQTQPTATVTSNGNPRENETIAAPTTSLPMVEINMQNTQYSHLREDLKSSHFLPNQTAVSPAKPMSTNPKLKHAAAQRRCLERKSLREQLCKKHRYNDFQRYTTGRNCYRGRLRSSQDKRD